MNSFQYLFLKLDTYYFAEPLSYRKINKQNLLSSIDGVQALKYTEINSLSNIHTGFFQFQATTSAQKPFVGPGL